MEASLILEKRIENKKSEYCVSLINGIRRSIMCDIDVYCIDMDSTEFFENSKVIDNEFVNKRLSLIPIISDYPDVDYDSIRIVCKTKNNTQDSAYVYFSDLEFMDATGKKIAKSFSYFPKIPVTKLKPNHSISFETRLKKSNSMESGAGYNPTSTCVHTFEIDREALEAKIVELGLSEKEANSFRLDNGEQYYKRTEGDGGLPGVYNFRIESVGHLKAADIYQIGIEKLTERLLRAKAEINVKSSDKIVISRNKKSDEVYDIVFYEENDTLGNILSEYLSREPDVKYVGYRLSHPQKYEMHMKVSLTENNNKEGIAKKYIDVIGKVIKLLETLA